MTYYIRDKRNRDIVDLEFWVKTDYELTPPHRYLEISTYIDAKNYGKLLLDRSERFSRKYLENLMNDMSEIQELRGWMWENYFSSKQNTGSDEDQRKINDYIFTLLKEVCNKYDLYLVTD